MDVNNCINNLKNMKYFALCQAVCSTHLSHLLLQKHSASVSLQQPCELQMLFIPRKVGQRESG